MRRFLTVMAALTLGVVVGRLWQDPPAFAVDPPCALDSANGNVNGDESIDVSDAVYLLNYLFAGGPPLCDNRAELRAELDACRIELEACRQALERCEGSGELRWYTTCGDPVCGGHRPVEGLPVCTTEEEGAPCEEEGALCDLEDDCNRRLVCARQDPKAGGCPISRRRHKRDIAYLSDDEVARVGDELLRMRIARWNYNWDPASARPRLGFLIDDQPGSPAVTSDGERVDLYGYTSLTVAALQSLERQLDGLRRELDSFRSAKRKPNPQDP